MGSGLAEKMFKNQTESTLQRIYMRTIQQIEKKEYGELIIKNNIAKKINNQIILKLSRLPPVT